MRTRVITNKEEPLRGAVPTSAFTDGVILGERMVKLLRNNKGKWTGVAAPQLGERTRVVATYINGVASYLINPNYVPVGEKELFEAEGCLSFPGRRFDTQRYQGVMVSADNLEEPVTLSGIEAISVQHEVDHLDGILVMDHGKEIPKLEPERRTGPKIGRNDPCPCGSGLKSKKCCKGEPQL